MELNEAVLRILRHSRLIVAVVLVCLAIPLVGSRSASDTYTASARVSFGAEPANEDEAAAMVDTADALVTTPGEVEAALGRYADDRDPALVEEGVGVESVGVSGVLTISASDENRKVATVVANGLVRRFLTARQDLVLEPLESRLEDVEAQLAFVNEDIRNITLRGSNLPEAIDARRLRLDAALSRQAGLRAERERLITNLDATPRPALLARATVPTVPDPSGRTADLLVAGLLGLVLGVAIAAVLEASRPTIVGRDALAAALGAPILGQIPNPFPPRSHVRDVRVAVPLALAAATARVHVVHLTSTDSAIDLLPLAEHLEDGAPDLTVDTVGTALPSRSRSGSRTRPDREGLVVVAPEVQPRKALSDVEQLLAVSQWPLVGILIYPSSIWRRRPATGAVRRRLHEAHATVSSMMRRRRPTPRHAGTYTGSTLVGQYWVRLRRLVRAPWGSETKS